MATATQAKFLPFHLPLIEERDIDAVAEAMRSGWITTGPKTNEFEDQFANFVGARYSLAVMSGTAALHLGLEALGIKAGDEVVLPALTFAATAEVVQYLNAKPVLVDSEPEYFNISMEDLQRKINPRTKAIIPVHFAGHACDMQPILEFARANRLGVIEDAAHALPAAYRGRMIGSIGNLTAFSFYATKTLTTGEGGMVTTDDPQLAERMRLMRLHGLSRDAWKRYDQHGTWRYDIIEAGFKYNLTDIQSALGLVQLSKANAMRETRARIADRYTRALDDMPAFRTPRSSKDVLHSWHLYVILVEPDRLRIGRDEVIEELRKRGIGCAVHFIPLHFHSFYQSRWGYAPGQFPVVDRYFERCISLPIYPGMNELDVDRVTDALADVANKFER
jgi:dTDP-4-amino-4,6-dideoxygalactose transaminase